MAAYYNEIDPFAAQWLRNLIVAGHIAPGEVDERSIVDVEPADLKGFTQCHFFAGVGVWSYALRRSMWPDERPVWTGSCPCQPFSAAGNQKGAEDERHLWPAWFELVEQCEPSVIFAEQVASSEVVGRVDGTGENVWIDTVSTDLERALYAVGTFDLPAAGFGGPHIRQRSWLVAERLGNCGNAGLQGYWRSIQEPIQEGRQRAERHAAKASSPIRVVNANGGNTGSERQQPRGQHGQQQAHTSIGHGTETAGSVNGFWRDADWLGCTDGYFRPVEPSAFPLADGATQRMGRIRAYGNAICAEVATGFISAYLDQQ